jgi:Uma2 family endonuclease
MATVDMVRPPLTFADLERMPDDGRRYELYDGEVVVVPSPLPRHQMVLNRLMEVLGAYARQHGATCLAAPLDIVFSENTVLQPDIVFFSSERRHLIHPDRVIRDPPDLCVEILSPSTAGRDRRSKKEIFARFGVKEYWIVDPAGAAFEQYGLEAGRFRLLTSAGAADIVTSPLLPNLSFSVGQIFQDVL